MRVLACNRLQNRAKMGIDVDLDNTFMLNLINRERLRSG